ncbi:hypothetical protein M8C21_001640 [Ambrosia artemisiifolia]|uniref:Uncharacterized protein n=1 Tax=Ambrosia artemisiifolia TaxID=4212 RepID=A0AAD5G833_AMBAR|nr:hypothetical protein M8C21_001640 [Ambrosia artemisiifolia]
MNEVCVRQSLHRKSINLQPQTSFLEDHGGPWKLVTTGIFYIVNQVSKVVNEGGGKRRCCGGAKKRVTRGGYGCHKRW